MAYKNPNVSKPAVRVERVEGIDLGIVDKYFVDNLKTLVVTNPDTQEFHSTAPIIEFAKANTHMYAKDANGVVYTNSDYYAQKFQDEIDKGIKDVKLSLADAIAIKCLNDNRTPVIIDGFNSNSIKFVNEHDDQYTFKPELIEALTKLKNTPALFTNYLQSNESLAIVDDICRESGVSIVDLDYAKRCGVTEQDIADGLRVIVTCGNSQEVGTYFKRPDSKILIPHLQDFGYENGLVAIESRSKCFTNVPEVAERYEQRKIELDIYNRSSKYMTQDDVQQHKSEFHAPEPFGNNAFYTPGDLQPSNDNFFHAPGDIGEDGPGNR